MVEREETTIKFKEVHAFEGRVNILGFYGFQ
jgi:hypothetical protein